MAAHGAVTRTGDTAPCWKLLLNDWYDGTINKIYPVPCYQQAINHLPADLRIYGSARDDILAARQSAIRHQSAPPEHGGTGASTTTTTTAVVNGTTTTTVIVVPVQTTTTKKATPFLDRLNPGNADSFPLPLLILGALAILLVIAGAAGMLWQRSHPRDDDASAA
jgi:hypothetical protein